MKFTGSLFEEDSEMRGKLEVLPRAGESGPGRTFYFKSFQDLADFLEAEYQKQFKKG